MSDLKSRCRTAVGILEAARDLVEKARTEAGGAAWDNNERDARSVLKAIERIQQRLLMKHDGDNSQ